MIEMRHFLNRSERTRAADNCVLVSNKIGNCETRGARS